MNSPRKEYLLETVCMSLAVSINYLYHKIGINFEATILESQYEKNSSLSL